MNRGVFRFLHHPEHAYSWIVYAVVTDFCIIQLLLPVWVLILRFEERDGLALGSVRYWLTDRFGETPGSLLLSYVVCTLLFFPVITMLEGRPRWLGIVCTLAGANIVGWAWCLIR